MIIFLDFEASSLGRHGFPIEVGWAGEDGAAESHLIRPAPGWEDWAESAERVHAISLKRLRQEGTPHGTVAARMVQILQDHQLYASAPSWDGQWLSGLLRAAGLPRHALRLRHTDEAQRATARTVLETAGVPTSVHRDIVEDIIDSVRQTAKSEVVAHRALEDARRELRLWQEVRYRAELVASRWSGSTVRLPPEFNGL